MSIEILCPEFKKMEMAKISFERFVPRIQGFIPASVKEFKTEKNGDANYKKEKEEKEVLKFLSEKDYLILLDETGKKISSRKMSEELSKIQKTFPSKKIIFLIGGPYGVSQHLKERADMKLALSDLTFNSEIAITVFFEQLYRVLAIQAGHPYHND